MSGREARAVEAIDGTRLHYEVEGDGPYDVLLCDGIGCDGYIWRYLWPHLLERARVIHPHVRGHGRSAPPADRARVGIAHIAEDFLRVLDACGSERAVVIGHSMGVQVSLELWHLAPTRVMGLGLMCGSYGRPASTFRDAQFMKHLPRGINFVVTRALGIAQHGAKRVGYTGQVMADFSPPPGERVGFTGQKASASCSGGVPMCEIDGNDAGASPFHLG